MKDRVDEIARNPQYDGYQRALATMVPRSFDKKTGAGASGNEVLAQELHKPVIKQFKRRKANARFKDNIWAGDLTKMGSLYPFNHGGKFLLNIIDILLNMHRLNF